MFHFVDFFGTVRFFFRENFRFNTWVIFLILMLLLEEKRFLGRR